MPQVAIREIVFDPAGGGRVVPDLPLEQDYDAVYRGAMSVRWDDETRTVYMLPRRDRTPLEAFQRIVTDVAVECGDQLVLTPDTVWRDISLADQAAMRAWLDSVPARRAVK